MNGSGGWIRLIGMMVAAAILLLPGGQTPCNASAWVQVKWVVDGDTIVLTDGRHVRYIGIDAPEVDHGDRQGEAMGEAARSFNRHLVNKHRLRLSYDLEKSDRYGRTLAYVYRRDGLFVNVELIQRGYAHVLYRHPNTGKQEMLLGAQRKAMLAGRGIWRLVEKGAASGSPFPGNRRSRRFHHQTCQHGQRISSRNRVWFNSQWDAFWSGYAPAAECIPFPPKD